MKKVEHYICEICGTEYNDKNKCIQCEKNHCKGVEIVGYRFQSYKSNRKGYPDVLNVKMEDGTVQAYKR